MPQSVLDPRWKNPPGRANDQIFRWAQDLISELRKGKPAPILRTRLTAATTFFVDPVNGNDNSDGLGSGVRAFATVAAAYASIQNNYDFNGQTVTLQLANATYSNLVFSNGWTGGGKFILDGGTGTINGTGGSDGIVVDAPIGNQTFDVFTIKNATFGVTSGAGACIRCQTGVITVGTGCTFGAAGSGGHLLADGNTARLMIGANYTVSGGGAYHYTSVAGGIIDQALGSTTVTISAAVTLSIFAFAVNGGLVLQGFTYVNPLNVTGTRYLSWANGYINTGTGTANNSNSGTATYFPGTVAGSIATGGQYY